MNNPDNIIDQLRTPEECESFAQRCISLAKEARRRAIELRALAHGNTNVVETELLKVLYAYEEVLTTRNKRRTRASRTWQMVKKYGIIRAAERAVNRKADPMGYTVLIEKGMQDLTFEAVILKYPESFSHQAVQTAKIRLEELERESPPDNYF
jgi:hypothetical protein